MADENAGATDATSAAAVPTDGSVVTGAPTQDTTAAAGTTKTDPTAEGTKVEGDKKPEGEKKDADGEKKPDADKPIEYAEFKLPEGVKVDEDALTNFKAISQEAKIPQEVAQKYVDLYAGKLKEAHEGPYKLWHDTQAKWVKEINEDKEVGGDKLAEATSNAAKALDHPALKVPGLREALIFTGAGNHPAVLKFFARVGKAVSSETFAGTGGAATQPKSTAELMYPSMAAKE